MLSLVFLLETVCNKEGQNNIFLYDNDLSFKMTFEKRLLNENMNFQNMRHIDILHQNKIHQILKIGAIVKCS